MRKRGKWKVTSNEGLYVDKNGKKSDRAFHEAILDNPEADEFIAEQAVARAIQLGIPLDEAKRMFDPKYHG